LSCACAARRQEYRVIVNSVPVAARRDRQLSSSEIANVFSIIACVLDLCQLVPSPCLGNIRRFGAEHDVSARRLAHRGPPRHADHIDGIEAIVESLAIRTLHFARAFTKLFAHSNVDGFWHIIRGIYGFTVVRMGPRSNPERGFRVRPTRAQYARRRIHSVFRRGTCSPTRSRGPRRPSR
jgi:hypothetical protein